MVCEKCTFEKKFPLFFDPFLTQKFCITKRIVIVERFYCLVMSAEVFLLH